MGTLDISGGTGAVHLEPRGQPPNTEPDNGRFTHNHNCDRVSQLLKFSLQIS